MAAINVRCLEDVDRSKLKVVPVDGKNFYVRSQLRACRQPRSASTRCAAQIRD